MLSDESRICLEEFSISKHPPPSKRKKKNKCRVQQLQAEFRAKQAEAGRKDLADQKAEADRKKAAEEEERIKKEVEEQLRKEAEEEERQQEEAARKKKEDDEQIEQTLVLISSLLAWDKTPKNLEEIVNPADLEEERRLAAEAAEKAAKAD